MISFLSPWFLAGVATAAVPIVLHLLKRRPEARVKFAAVDMLRSAPVESLDRRHLRQLLLLALRIAALVLLAVAFARPFVPAAATAGSGLTIVALDTSMSLSAPGLFDHARQMAIDAIRNAPSGDLVGVVTFADTAQEAARPSADRDLAVAAVRGAQPGFGATRYRAAFDRAADMIVASGGRASRVVAVTDLQESGWDAGGGASIPESTRIEVTDVGPSPPNLAVTEAHASGGQVTATVLNAGSQPREVRVAVLAVSAGGDRGSQSKPAGQAVVSIGANQSVDVVLAAPDGESAEILVDDPRGMPGDNARYVVLDHANRASVAVVTTTGDLSKEAFYLQQALAVRAKADGAAPVQGMSVAQVSAWDQDRMRQMSAIVLLATRGIERRGREHLADYVRQGGGLLTAAGPDMDREVVSEILGSAKVTLGSDEEVPQTFAPSDGRHPMFQAFGADLAGVGLVRFARAAPIQSPECQVMARFTRGGAALVDCSPGDGRALVFASDLDNRWNDFPLHASFVPFVHEALAYLAGPRPSSSGYVIGETPPGVAPEPGVVRLPPAAGSRLVAVNVDSRESDGRRLSVDEFQSAVARLKDAGAPAAVRYEFREQEDRQHIWQYVLALMAGILVVESLVARRAA